MAADLGIDEDVLRRVRAEYEEHARALDSGVDSEDGQAAADGRDLERRLRLGVLEHKRRAVTDLRNANRIDDIVLRDLQAGMDLEEVRLLGPPPTE